MRHIYPVILSGGAGTRLWPLSRSDYPKQFLSLDHSDKPFIIKTMERLQGYQFAPPTIIAAYHHRFIINELIQRYKQDYRAVLLEPEGKNTAPAIMLAARHIIEEDPQGIMVVLPSDHMINDQAYFQQVIEQAVALTDLQCTVTLSVHPTSPHTGYGYIQAGDAVRDGAFYVKEFIEKPPLEQAMKLIQNQHIGWNSGIFVVSCAHAIHEIEEYQPELAHYCQRAYEESYEDLNFQIFNREYFAQIPALAFDVAVMEQSSNRIVIPTNMQWSDLGSWQALWEACHKDDDGNAAYGDYLAVNSQNNYVHSDDGTSISLLGVNDMMVISHDQHILVAPRSEAENVKHLPQLVEKQAWNQEKDYTTTYRPWGHYRTMVHGDGYLVKIITVYPKGKLSLQYHKFRTEHWVIVDGIAHITYDQEEKILYADQAIYIPQQTIHRIENQQDELLILIEVQTGEYLSEDDIVRLDDVYKRS
jgi:mannose-1-phosphate guanylyltransferase/mannose-6-phosphate isomerase